MVNGGYMDGRMPYERKAITYIEKQYSRILDKLPIAEWEVDYRYPKGITRIDKCKYVLSIPCKYGKEQGRLVYYIIHKRR